MSSLEGTLWLIIIMHAGVGKTSLAVQFIHGTFREMYSKTIEDTYRWSASKRNIQIHWYCEFIQISAMSIIIVMILYRKVISAKTNQSASAVWTHPTLRIQLCIPFLVTVSYLCVWCVIVYLNDTARDQCQRHKAQSWSVPLNGIHHTTVREVFQE